MIYLISIEELVPDCRIPECRVHFAVTLLVYQYCKKKMKKNHNTGTIFYTSIVHNTSIPVLRSSQDLNNICLYLKESYSLRDSIFLNI
jgi:hypothetical protein